MRGFPGRAEGASPLGTPPPAGLYGRQWLGRRAGPPEGPEPAAWGWREAAAELLRSGCPSAEPRRRLRPRLARRPRPWGGRAERRAGVSVCCGGPRHLGAAYWPRPRLAVSVAGEGRAWRSRVPGQSRRLCPALLRGPRPRGGERCPGGVRAGSRRPFPLLPASCSEACSRLPCREVRDLWSGERDRNGGLLFLHSFSASSVRGTFFLATIQVPVMLSGTGPHDSCFSAASASLGRKKCERFPSPQTAASLTPRAHGMHFGELVC